MSSLSRFLPIIGVAVGGVLAMKVITSVGVLPDVFHKASAVAAEAKPAKKADKAGGSGEKVNADDPTLAFGVSGSALTADSAAKDAVATVPTVAPVCATSLDELAKDAGISPGEYRTLQDLGTRRQQLDAWQAQLNSQSQLVQAAGGKLDSRISQLTALKTQIQTLIDQASKTQSDDTGRMIKVYEAMKPQAAAQVLTTMSDDVRLPIAAGMKDRALAAVLAVMTPDAARELTEKLANRMKAANGLQQKLNNVTQAAPANAGQAQAEAAADASSSASSSSAAPDKLASADQPAKKTRPKTRQTAARTRAKPTAKAPDVKSADVKAADVKAGDPSKLAAAKSSTAGASLPSAPKPQAAPAAPSPAGNSK
jgi:flagellar motility protein MotE (MotC chaperone)